MITVGHSIVCGKTGFGKTTLVKKLTRKMNKNGIPVMVLTPFPQDPEWLSFAAVVTDITYTFVKTVFENTDLALEGHAFMI